MLCHLIFHSLVHIFNLISLLPCILSIMLDCVVCFVKMSCLKKMCFLKKKKNFSKNATIMFWKWLKIFDNGSFGVTVVFAKESRGIKFFVKCCEKYLSI